MVPTTQTPFWTQSVVRFSVLIFLLVLATRVGILFLFPGSVAHEPEEMERVARSFAEGHGLADPYATPTGPTAHVLPLYPMLLGTIYRIWGLGETGKLAQGIFSCTLVALRCGLLFPFALFMGLNRRTAQLACILSIFYIPTYYTEIGGAWEAPLAALFMMGLISLAALVVRHGELSFPVAAGCGLFLGISALISTALVIPSLGFMVIGVWIYRRKIVRYLAWCSVCCAVVILCLTPWAMRNHRELGRTIWTRSDLGLELYFAYHDGTTVAVSPSAFNSSLLPADHPEASDRLRAMGEVQYNDMLKREALLWISRNPEEAAKLVAGRIVAFWFPPIQFTQSRWIPMRLIRGLETVFAWWGLWLLIARRAFIGYILAVLWIVYPLIYYFFVWSSRYRYPMEWTMVLAVAVVLSTLWSKCGSGLLSRRTIVCP